ncbi:MAG: hypothetical protein AAGF26_01745 [Cyanobacteria bacterium P01_G01_bin.49]
MSHCAALIYARTYEVDFRFIAMPEDFTSDDKNWAWDYIRVTTRTPEQLPENPRWSIFKNDRYCVFGVTCMVRELIGRPTGENSEDLTKDSKGRPIYIFAGYVTQIGQEIAKENKIYIPPYSGNNLELFQPLYEYVSNQWLVKSYEPQSRNATPSEYKAYFSQEQTIETSQDFDQGYFALNTDNSQIVSCWPDVAESAVNNHRKNLWLAASKSLENFFQKNVSLCLGLATEKDALSGLFLNASVVNLRQKDNKIKITETRVQPEENPPQPNTTRTIENPRQRNTTRMREIPQFESNESGLEIVDFVGAGVGVVLGWKMAGLAGIVVGGGVGWIAIGLLTEKGTGGKIRKIVEQSFLENQREGRRNNRSYTPNQDENYGFRAKNEERDVQESKDSEGNADDSSWF